MPPSRSSSNSSCKGSSFYGIGFGLFGQIALAPLLVSATVFFCLEMVVSRAWLSVAYFGPVEWIWRQFTYGRRFPLFRPRQN
jgi:uncharacterized protein